MSDDSIPERIAAPEARKEPAKDPRDSWIERFKLALGLKAPASIRDDLEDALEESDEGETDEFTREEKRILRNLLTARDIRVQDVMVPRGAIAGIAESAPFSDLRALFTTAAHSRVPVYGETLDDPKGMIHIRDMFARLDVIPLEAKVADIGLIRPVLFAPGSMPALDLLIEMQAKRIHMALVIDEYGATDGLVSLEDLLEIIVGEIEDEHDIVEDSVVEHLLGGAIAINAHATIEEVARLMGVDLETESDEHDIGTIGGYVTALLGRVPGKGEAITAPNGMVFTVLDGDARRLKRIRIVPAPSVDET
jgi:CBS domain containing-hemolysin-like protein